MQTEDALRDASRWPLCSFQFKWTHEVRPCVVTLIFKVGACTERWAEELEKTLSAVQLGSQGRTSSRKAHSSTFLSEDPIFSGDLSPFFGDHKLGHILLWPPQIVPPALCPPPPTQAFLSFCPTQDLQKTLLSLCHQLFHGKEILT